MKRIPYLQPAEDLPTFGSNLGRVANQEMGARAHYENQTTVQRINALCINPGDIGRLILLCSTAEDAVTEARLNDLVHTGIEFTEELISQNDDFVETQDTPYITISSLDAQILLDGLPMQILDRKCSIRQIG